MSEAKHTPGPWTAWNRGIGWEVHHSVDDDGYGISVNDGFRETFSEADARLIAAAPDMLAALERVVEDLHGWAEYGSSASMHLYEDAKAAITKAKGAQ